MTSAINISIVEDDAGVRERLAVLINGAPGFRCISTFPNAELALKNLRHAWPDVVLMDINLPEMSGIECVRKLKAMRPALQVLMLTVYMENEKIFQSLIAGATGYLLKQTTPGELLEAIQEVQNGGSPMSSQIARKVVQFIQQAPAGSGADVGLSKREHEILTHLSHGYRYKEIADMLGISTLTVRNHLQNIYQKLHVRSGTEAVIKFLGKAGP